MTAKSQVVSSKLLIVHFALASIMTAGNPAASVCGFLQSFLQGAIEYREIRFDISSADGIRQHNKALGDMLSEVSRYGSSWAPLIFPLIEHVHADKGFPEW
jgi:hypothetical protein